LLDLLRNAVIEHENCGDNCLMTDATFNLVAEKWATSSIGCRTLTRKGDKVVQSYRPFSFIMSKTESRASYSLLLSATKEILFLGEGFKLTVKVINMDHHDGSIKCFQDDDSGMYAT
jgi:hypothetical protein